ncbi:pyridoxamine 5'-phosphate oxidase family protein [Hyphomicrobium sp.]|uniref:pyridoxamine 5'-phosphate oxidase family protein n=1 Tax=Hyphomicrobium sp. TaxID=82 RepID=UPI0025BB5CE7|nr:pyridoxamine 5'-phosphate oxidase family protein [Hyphomicrobium sp.]MCC7253944.1 pyridoxamine 5'-phosphate oxidase family protein [Hyphomicrobium sp.]
MSQKSLADIASDMRGIDIAMLSTITEDGGIASRPMSNNGDVTYDGNSYYFTRESARMVRDIERDPDVSLAFASKPGLLSSGVYIAIAGRAEIIRDKAAFEAHWTPDLDAWFEQGIDTPGVVMLKVHADRIKYWSGAEQGEVAV